MKQKALLPLLLLAATNVNAQTYNSILSASTYKHGDYDTNLAVTGTYFFDGISSKGPLDYFGFNTRENAIGGSFYFSENDYSETDGYSIHGEYNWGNFQFSASHKRDSYKTEIGNYSYEGDSNHTGLGVQYFISENWGIGYADGDLNQANIGPLPSSFVGSHVYTNFETTVTGSDSLGLSLYYLDDASEFLAGVDYFTAINNGQYIRAEVIFDDELTILANAQYYFSEATYASVSVFDGELDGIGFAHFFNPNFKAQFAVSNLNGEENVYAVSALAYF